MNTVILTSARTKPVAILAVLSFGAILGGVIAILPYWFIFAGLLMPIMLVLAVSRPNWAALILILFASGLIPVAFTPSLPLLGGTIRSSDLFLAMLAVVTIFRIAVRKDRFFDSGNALYKPIYFFLFLSVLSFVLAVAIFGNPPKYIAYELRVCLYWIFAFIIAQSIQSESSIRNTVVFIVCMSVVLSVAVIAQSVTGVHFLAGARVESLDNAGTIMKGVTRSTFGGFQNFVVFSLVFLLAKIAREEVGMRWSVPLVVVLVGGLLVTFGRGVWLGAVVVVAVAAVRLGVRRFARIFIAGILVSIAVALLVAAVRPEVFEAVESRIASVSEDIQGGESWKWRQSENSYALKKLESNFVTGIGLGGEYQPLRNHFMSPEQTRMIHNSYLYLMLKFGVLGLLFPLWLTYCIWKESGRLAVSGLRYNYSALAISLGASVWVTIVTGFTQPEWMEHKGVLFMSSVVGLLVALGRIQSERTDSDQASSRAERNRYTSGMAV